MDGLAQIVTLWRNQITLAEKAKARYFGRTARRVWKYVGKRHENLAIRVEDDDSEEGPDFPLPSGWKRFPQINKTREFIATMMPYILARVPHRLVTPRRPQMPKELADIINYVPNQEQEAAEKLVAFLMQWVLNYLPGEQSLLSEQRRSVPEALAKGRGVVWHERMDTPYGPMPAAYHDSVDNVLIDPDCEQLRDGGFIVRRRRRSTWAVARQYGVDVNLLRGAQGSALAQSIKAATGASSTAAGPDAGDVVTYHEVWSRMGVGHLLVGASTELRERLDVAESLGQHVWLAIVPGLNWPLNLPPDSLADNSDAELRARISWPIPFHGDLNDPWPCSFLDFLPNQTDPWATSPLEGALPLQIFLDRLYTYLMDHVKRSCRTIWVLSDALDSDVKDAIEGGMNMEMAFTANVASEIKDLIYLIEGPPVSKDLWQILALIEETFERMTGETPLLSGAEPTRAFRSSAEATIRESHSMSRPDDYADCVEEWNTAIAAKQAMAVRLSESNPWMLFGEPKPEEQPEGLVYPGILSDAWERLIRTDDPYMAAADLTYSVEAGSGRRPNKQKQMADAQSLVQLLLGPFLELATGGRPKQYNNLMEILGEAYDMPMQRLMFDVMENPEEQAEQMAAQIGA